MIMHRFILHEAMAFLVLLLGVCQLPAAGENPQALRYGFQPGRQYAFEVKIQAELEDCDEFREGVLSYSVISAQGEQFVLRPSGNLSLRTQSHPGAHPFSGGFPPPPHFPSPRFLGIGGPEGMTFNRQGEKLVSRELTSLPYLLGDMELLVFEEFPVEAKPTWEKQREILVVERESGGRFPRFMFAPRGADGKHTTAKEQINYAIVKREKDAVEISKRYSLQTSPEADQTSRIEMTGQGHFIFDLKEGMIRSLSMKYVCQENEKNVTRRIPVTVTFRLLSVAEMAERQKKADEAQAAAKKAAEPKAFEPGERARLLQDLRSADPQRLRSAADRLAKTPVDHRPADFARALAPLLRHPDEWVQGAAAKALTVWVTPEAEKALLEATKAENHWVRTASIEALGKLKSAKAAEAVAAQMYRSRHEAAQALKAMGPVAEAATIGCLGDRDMWVRAEACSVLGEIGGRKALAALHEFTPKAGGMEARNANHAISAIGRRLELQPDAGAESEALQAKSSEAAGHLPAESSEGFRTWRDKSGVFSVEAALLRQEDGKVVLQKKDGKTIRVPLEKLSPADRKYLAEHADDSSKKPENPFE
jgi:hypothetical protein